jgi:hypothetical protein
MKMRVYEVELFPVLELGEYGDDSEELGGTVVEISDSERERYRAYMAEYKFWQDLLHRRANPAEL